MIDYLKKIDEKELQKSNFIQKYGLSSWYIKIIALISMVLDHCAIAYVTNEEWIMLFRGIGRLSFPIFCFILVESFSHTSNRWKMLLRLTGFAIISEIPYDLVVYNEFFYWQDQNVFWLFDVAFIVMWVTEYINSGKTNGVANTIQRLLGRQVLLFLVATLGLVMAYYFNLVYSYGGMLLILLFYYLRDHFVWQMLANIAINIGVFGGRQSLASLSVIILLCYNGKRGEKHPKYFFYLIYPVHLWMIYGINAIFCH